MTVATCTVFLAGCGTAKEKSAPCKRPSVDLMSYAPDPRKNCGDMHRINDPEIAFSAIGVVDAGTRHGVW